MPYAIKTILNEEEISFLNEFYVNQTQKPSNNYRNLVQTKVVTLKTLDKSIEWLPSVDISSPIEEKSWIPIEKKLDLVYNSTSVAHYLVYYGVGSSANLHRDRIPNTLVTIIDTSDDLEGGSVILVDEGRPILLNPRRGETLSYSDYTVHGVSKLTKGSRLALISWYN